MALPLSLRRARWLGRAAAVCGIVCGVATSASAQRAPAPPRPLTAADSIRDSLRKPPLTPGHAFFLSLLVPGAAQARLDRPISSMLFATAEILSLGMARSAAQDLREALALSHDSTVASYTVDTAGHLVPSSYIPSRFTPARIRARRTHYEDWLAALLFNHLIAGADAYVAANLWDFNANVSPNVVLNPVTRSATLGATITF